MPVFDLSTAKVIMIILNLQTPQAGWYPYSSMQECQDAMHEINVRRITEAWPDTVEYFCMQNPQYEEPF